MYNHQKTYSLYQPSSFNKPLTSYLKQDSDKENRNPFDLKKQYHHQHRHSESDPHFAQQVIKPKTARPLGEIYRTSCNEPTQTYDYASMFSGMVAQKSAISIKTPENTCMHTSIKRSKKAFCGDCGLFLPKV